MTHLKSLKVYPEDVFREVAYMLDYLLTAEDVIQKEIDGLWVLLINDIREWKSDVQDEDKMLFAGTVFIMVKKILCHHCESRYCDTIHDMLDAVIEEKLSIPDDQEHQQFLDRLLECSDMLSEWVNQYEDCDEWLSEEIEMVLNPEVDGKPDEEMQKETIPKELLTKEAQLLWEKLRDAGFILANGYSLADGLSANQATYIADCMATKLGIRKKWKVFQQLWGIRNMAQMAGAWKETGKEPPRAKEIRKLIE